MATKKSEQARNRRIADVAAPSRHVDLPVEEVPQGTTLLPSSKGGLPSERSRYSKAPQAPDPSEVRSARSARASREAWESSPEGQARTADVQSLLGTKAPHALIYAEMGWGRQTGTGPRVYDRQLPGLEDPMSAPRPARWEELAPETRHHVERHLKQHGTDIDTMTSDFGAQLDQSYVRAASRGHDLPYATDFYSTGEPVQVIKDSARELGIPMRVHTLMNAITSPNTKFSQDTRDGRIYPNNEAASHVVRHVQGGGSPYYVPQTVVDEETGEILKKHQGYGANFARAGRGFAQWRNEGATPSEWRNKPSASNPQGSGMIGPKTGPYANSFSSDPQYFVSDVHSGGGGMLPHLSSDKPVTRGADGEAKPTKSEREVAIDRVTHFHAAADYAARQAMAKRGLTSVRDAQASQWGEEQIQRNLKGGMTEDVAYPRKVTPQMEGQGSLWPEMHLPPPKKKAAEGQGALF